MQKKYGVVLTKIGAIGFSAMMHGYMAFDKEDNLLVPFRTWRNSTTEKAAAELTKLFGFNIPERWSIAHLYQAILNEEDHVKKTKKKKKKKTSKRYFIHYYAGGIPSLAADRGKSDRDRRCFRYVSN